MSDSIDAVGIGEILKALPHRYPFLLVDKIIKINGEQSAIGIKNCTINEPHFVGHFPNNPIMPGVLLLEGMAQTGGVLCILASKNHVSNPYVYFMTIDGAKFRRPVVPGDVVEYHLELRRKRKSMWWYQCEAKVDGEIVAEALLGAMMRDH
jgi:3-hydroxyacyl-[acyl-carrier-protein] dehydratase